MRPWLRASLLLLGLTLSARRADAADTWIEVKSANFTVVTNAGEKKGQNIAFQFEQIRAATQAAWAWARADLDRPVIVVAAKDEDTMRKLAPQYWEGRNSIKPVSVSWSAADRLLIALRADVEVEGQIVNPYNSAFWSYSALVLQASFRGRLPLWLRQGMSTVMANTIIQKKEVQFGRPLPWVAQTAATGQRRPLAALLTMTEDDPYYRSSDTRSNFDAQCWALVQFMIFGTGDGGAKFNDVARRTLAGMASDGAVTEVYGSINALEDPARLYAERGIYKFARMPTSEAIVQERLPVRPLGAVEATASRALFLATLGRGEEARALITEARSADPASVLADEAEAHLLEHDQKTDEAVQLYAKAAKNGSTDYWTFYRAATAQMVGSRDPQTLEASAVWLDRAIALNERFLPAVQAAGGVQLQLNQPERALPYFTRLASLEPDASIHQLMLARTHLQLRRTEEAEKAARQALALARTAADRTNAENLLSMLSTARTR